ncbi:MAG: dTDP-4-dehydrorhamnose reductase [Rickettsiales bacterium]
MKNILVFGKHGQVGRALQALLPEGNHFAGREQADLSKPETLKEFILKLKPSAIINAAAYTKVDKAEEEEALAYAINAQSPAAMAEAAKELDIPFVHISTDYVFDGEGTKPWTEDDKTAPQNAYGRTKRAGEEKIEKVGGKYFIFRTSWVFDSVGPNFLVTMLRLGKEREELRVVSDQVGAPTYAPHLAEALLKTLDKFPLPFTGEGQGGGKNAAAFPPPNLPPQAGGGMSGIYHLCNRGETSWHGFAEAIFREAKAKKMELKVERVLPIPSSAYPTPAKRPQNSRMDCSKAKRNLGIELPQWEEGLKAALELSKNVIPT